MKRTYLSFGSNLGDRAENIRRALALLAENGVEIRRVSSFYETEPVDYRNQPWFVNCAAEAATSLMPLQLLRRIQAVERALGRQRTISKGPRSIDIDILIYENAVVRSSALTIPHARIDQRRFVLVPLSEIAGHLRHPVTRLTVREMLEATTDSGKVVKLQASRPQGRVRS